MGSASGLTEGNPDLAFDLRFCFGLEREEVERFNVERLSVLQRGQF